MTYLKHILYIIIMMAATGCSLKNQVLAERESIIQNIKTQHKMITKKDIEHLPFPVKKWLTTCGIIGKQKIQTVEIEQKLYMKLNPNKDRWRAGTASQVFTTNQPAFSWAMNMRISPFIKIEGHDKFKSGKGEMQIRLNSIINLVKSTGSKIDEASLQRYLGESIWFPSAALSPYIQWEAIDTLSAKATIEVNGTRGSGVFHFNEQGDVVMFSAMRYKGNLPESKKYLWENKITKTGVINGIRVPVSVETTWKLDDGDWKWLKLEITKIIYDMPLREAV